MSCFPRQTSIRQLENDKNGKLFRNGVEMNRIAHQEDLTRPTTTANDGVPICATARRLRNSRCAIMAP